MQSMFNLLLLFVTTILSPILFSSFGWEIWEIRLFYLVIIWLLRINNMFCYLPNNQHHHLFYLRNNHKHIHKIAFFEKQFQFYASECVLLYSISFCKLMKKLGALTLTTFIRLNSICLDGHSDTTFSIVTLFAHYLV